MRRQMQDAARRRDEETKQTREEIKSIQDQIWVHEQARQNTKTSMLQKDNKIKSLEAKLGAANFGTTVKPQPEKQQSVKPQAKPSAQKTTGKQQPHERVVVQKRGILSDKEGNTPVSSGKMVRERTPDSLKQQKRTTSRRAILSDKEEPPIRSSRVILSDKEELPIPKSRMILSDKEEPPIPTRK